MKVYDLQFLSSYSSTFNALRYAESLSTTLSYHTNIFVIAKELF